MSHAAGYNVCIFAYGQTGSGKTHTMAGSDIEEYSGRGINYRALDDLFAINEERQGEVCTGHFSQHHTLHFLRKKHIRICSEEVDHHRHVQHCY